MASSELAPLYFTCFELELVCTYLIISLLYDFHQELKNAIEPDTSLVSIMTVNNEIGVKQPISDIGT